MAIPLPDASGGVPAGWRFAIDSIEGRPGAWAGAGFNIDEKSPAETLSTLDESEVFGFTGNAMFNEQLAKIEKAKADIAAAEAKLSADRVAALAKLPADFGFVNLNAFLKAVKAAYGKGGKAARGRKPAAAKAPKAIVKPLSGVSTN